MLSVCNVLHLRNLELCNYVRHSSQIRIRALSLTHRIDNAPRQGNLPSASPEISRSLGDFRNSSNNHAFHSQANLIPRANDLNSSLPMRRRARRLQFAECVIGEMRKERARERGEIERREIWKYASRKLRFRNIARAYSFRAELFAHPPNSVEEARRGNHRRRRRLPESTGRLFT